MKPSKLPTLQKQGLASYIFEFAVYVPLLAIVAFILWVFEKSPKF